ncbi:MAG: S9 family peptidase [Planctomycetota bacterium]|nr:S9 family peptidase [Planctomycetota bacterium]
MSNKIKADDLYRIEQIQDLRISPDGKHVACVKQRIDRESEKKYSDIWLYDTETGEGRQFTTGDCSDTSPRFSPDGSKLAFLSNRENEKFRYIYLISLSGGESQKLQKDKLKVSSLEWSPDGGKLLVEAVKYEKDELERLEDEKKGKLGVTYRRYDRFFYKLDAAGFKTSEHSHLWLVDAESGEAEQLTDGDYDESGAAWCPGGEEIVFVSNRSEDPERTYYDEYLWRIPAKGGELKKVNGPVGPKHNPCYSPDGKWIAYTGYEGKYESYKNSRLWVAPADNSREAICLTREHDFHVSHWTVNDLPGATGNVRVLWSRDGRDIYFPVAHNGNTVIKVVRDVFGERKVEDFIAVEGVVGNYGFDRDGKRAAYFFGTMTDPGQIHVLDTLTGENRCISSFNEWLTATELGEVEEVWFDGADGDRLQGWILKPPGFEGGRKYPSILEIHGGPRVQYGNFFMHEFFCLAARGYVVYFCNPRGGQGYGEEHSKSIVNDWGGADYRDLMAWSDYVGKLEYIDEERMGVTGGSYGGYMTNWIVAHKDRFAAAVTQRSVSNLVSMWGTSDFNWVFQHEFGGKPPYEDIEDLWRQSPIRYFANVKTPTMVIHSEQDLRCSIEQGEQVYIALRHLGVDTEFIRFPGEPHGLSRGGRTDRRVARLEHILRWFDKYLK